MWNNYRDEISDDENENNAARNKINNNKTITSKSFEYRAKLKGRTPNNNKVLDAEVVVPLKYWSKFGRPLGLPLINCEKKLDLSRSKECIISEISITHSVPVNPDTDPPVPAVAAIQTTTATFQINNARFYVPVVTFSINDNITFLENIKQGFKKKVLATNTDLK